MKAYYDEKPLAFAKVGNVSYLYRFNIEKITKEDENGISELYQCDEVTVWNPITSNKVTKTVITTMYDRDFEQKLINEYNAVKLGISTDTTKLDAYTNYLTERDNLKKQIDNDCKENGIN